MADFPHDTIKLIQQALSKFGLTNPILQSGILAVVSTEGSFYPKDEIGWAGTPVARARIYFGDRLKAYNDVQLVELMKDNSKFFEVVYGYQTAIGKSLGNNLPGDGFKYIGRGFNGITGKTLYDKIGRAIGVDLVKNPSQLNQLPIAAAALAAYFKMFFPGVLASYKVTDPNQVKDLETATRMAFQVNAGAGTNIDANAGLKEELLKQLNNVKQLYQLAISNPGTTAGGFVAILAFIAFIFFLRALNKKKKVTK